MDDTYRPFTLTTAQCHEIVNNRIKRATERFTHLDALKDHSASRVDREICFLHWLKESLDSPNNTSGMRFTYNELEQFVGDAREP